MKQLGIVCLLLVLQAPVWAQMSPAEAMRRLRQAERRQGGDANASSKPHDAGIRAKRSSAAGLAPPVTDRGFRRATRGKVFYVSVPIVGQFGKEVTATGVELALAGAADEPLIKHIVFYIDSPGGLVSEADSIIQVMQRYQDRFKYHAVVKHAISAAIWVAFSCDTMHMREGGTIGGAVIYSADRTTGEVAVDEKLNSIIVARVVAAADTKGYPESIIRAMVLQKSEFYAYADAEGAVHTSVSRPGDLTDDKLIVADTEDSVLTLTQNKAVEIGLAESIDAEAAADANVGRILGIENLHPANRWGARCRAFGQMIKGMHGSMVVFRRLADVHPTNQTRRVHSAVVDITSEILEAVRHDPERVLHLVEDDGKTTRIRSLGQWKRNNLKCIRAWQQIRSKASLIYKEDITRDSSVAQLRQFAEEQIRRVRRVGLRGFAEADALP